MQKVLHITQKQGELVIAEIPKHKPGPGQILVKVHAAALNPVDFAMHQVGIFINTYPALFGFDLAGEVEEVGEGVTRLIKGDRVFGPSSSSPPDFIDETHTFQQYALASAATMGKIPNNISFDQAASIPCTLNAAFTGFYAVRPHGFDWTPPYRPEGAGKYSGPIVVLGGASSLGQFAIQLAKLSGFSPIITTASKKHEDFLTSLGATHVLDRSLDDDAVVSAVKTIIGDVKLEYICDSISRESTQALTIKLLPKGGSFVTSYLAEPIKPMLEQRTDIKVAFTLAFVDLPYNKELYETLFQEALPKWLEDGSIKPNRVEILPGGLAGIPDGLKRLGAGEVSGVKLIAHPQETV